MCRSKTEFPTDRIVAATTPPHRLSLLRNMAIGMVWPALHGRQRDSSNFEKTSSWIQSRSLFENVVVAGGERFWALGKRDRASDAGASLPRSRRLRAEEPRQPAPKTLNES